MANPPPDQPHFHKEILEQPKILANTLASYLAPNFQLRMSRPPLDDQTLRRIRNIYVTACGTSFHAAMTARYLIEELAQISCVVEPASECGSHHLLVDEGTLAVAVSQSGRSRDTLAALSLAASRGAVTLALVNERPSPLADSASGYLTILAGRVAAVASTKAFTSQAMVLGLMGLRIAQSRGLARDLWRGELESLARLPELVRHALSFEDQVTAAAARLAGFEHLFILARGRMLPMAFEGALKIKEVAKIHAEGLSAGEFGHGPLAMVGPSTPVILISFSDDDGDGRVSDLANELKARQAPLLLISEDGPGRDRVLSSLADAFLPLPRVPPRLRPMVAVVPLQLLACHIGLAKGLGVDETGGLLPAERLAAAGGEGPAAADPPADRP